MNWLDIVILVAVIIALFMGLRMGLIRAAALVVGVMVGLFLAGVYSTQVGDFLSQYISGTLANWAGFAVILIGAIIAANIVGRVLRKIISLLFLGWLDTLAGGVLGVALSTLVLGTLLSLAVAFPFLNLDEAVADSQLAPLILKAMPLVLALLPEQFDKVKDIVGI